jgi:hypothetical protein
MDILSFLIVGFGFSFLFFFTSAFYGSLACGDIEDLENGRVIKVICQFIKETGWYNLFFLVVGFFCALMFNPSFL